MRKLKFVTILVFCIILFVFASAVQMVSAQEVRLHYAGSTVGGGAYIVALAHAQVVNEMVDGVSITVESTPGGVDNARLVNMNEFQIGHAANIAAYNAYHGKGEFEGNPAENLRGWIPLYSSFVQIVVLNDSPIKTIEDLKGKRVSVGPMGSGTENIAKSFFTGAGMTYEDFGKVYYLPYAESNSGLIEGSLDAAFIATGIPTPAVEELSATRDIRILTVEPKEAKIITSDYPYFSPGIIPADTYGFLDKDLPTVRGATIAFIHKDIPEDVVYKMTKAIWENIDILASIHSSQKHLKPGMISSGVQSIMDLHPGAEKYYREQGWLD